MPDVFEVNERNINPTPLQQGNNLRGRALGLTNNRNGHRGIFIHYLFLNLSLRYAAYFKYTSRRLLEFFALLNAILMFLVLLYIHVSFVQNSSDCLSHVVDVWPRKGILRVQISKNDSVPPYKLYFVKESWTSSATLQLTPYDVMFKYSNSLSQEDILNYQMWNKLFYPRSTMRLQPENQRTQTCPNPANFKALRAFYLLEEKCPILKDYYIEEFKKNLIAKITSVITDVSMELYDIDNTMDIINEELAFHGSMQSHYENFDFSPVRTDYVIEYSTEFGYLRLTTAARHELGIPTLVVNLNPDREECFGNGLKKYTLDTFLGYDDFIMSSIKKLAEKDKSQGYLRNLVTGEYFRFITMWISNTSCVIAVTAMILFTLIVTILLRFSYHQIFMFMIEVLRVLDTDVRLVFPAAPMLTIILALVGMEEIMTEYFHNSTVAFYVILLIWAADQFDVICLHTVIARRHWVRFFFLYHVSFYIYHHKFNGQYNKLALFTSWLFIFHSMLYFLHHYEIPAIQRQMQVINERNRQRRRLSRNGGDGGAGGSTDENPDEEAHAPPDVASEANIGDTDVVSNTQRAPEETPVEGEPDSNNANSGLTVQTNPSFYDCYSLKRFKSRTSICDFSVFILFLYILIGVLIYSHVTPSTYGYIKVLI